VRGESFKMSRTARDSRGIAISDYKRNKSAVDLCLPLIGQASLFPPAAFSARYSNITIHSRWPNARGDP
jgi:hypothetical protein